MNPQNTDIIEDESKQDDSSSESSGSSASLLNVYKCEVTKASTSDSEDSLDIFGQARLFSRQNSPVHWTTLSDTIAVSPAGLPILKVVFCSSIETVNTLAWHDHQSLVNPSTQGRSMSVPNLDEEKQKFSDEQVMQMRNKLINLARHREVFRQLPKNQKLTLAVICMVYFTSFCAISVMAPFFHQVAVQHGISTSTYGLIFSIHPFVVFCTSPFIGQIIPTIGPKFMFIGGVFLSACCNILFGTLEFVVDDDQFMILCFLVRGLGAVGASAFSTAGATFVANLFPDKVSAVMGILETFIGLGFSIGPVIGGSLYTLGGFQLPFYVLGALMLLTLPFNLSLLPAAQPTLQKNLGSKVLLIFKIPAVFVVCLVVAVSSSAWSILEPTLIIHMQQFELPPLQLGLLFLLSSASYAISSPFWGWLADKYDHENLMMITGLSVTALSLLLLGPSPVFPGTPNTLWLNILSLILLGIFVALAYLPTYQALLHYAKQVGCDTGMSTYSIIAGLWASMYSLGEVIGPSLGGLLVDLYDFPFAMTAVAFLNLGVALLLLLLCSFQSIAAHCRDKEIKKWHLMDESEIVSSSQHQQVLVETENIFIVGCSRTEDEYQPLMNNDVPTAYGGAANYASI